MCIFEIESLFFHISKTALNVPTFTVGFKDFLRFLNVGSNSNIVTFDLFAHNHNVGILDHMVQGALFSFLQMIKETLQRPFIFAPLNKPIILNADKKGMLLRQRYSNQSLPINSRSAVNERIN